MNKTVFLSQENPALAKAELFALCPMLKVVSEHGHILEVTGHVPEHLPAALTHKIMCGKKTMFHQPEQWFRHKAKSPITLSPKLARALVNIAAPRKTVVIDPFCGIGTILLEAALTGHEVIGYDIDQIALDQGQKRFGAFGVRGTFICRDARSLAGSLPAVVTDLPYGRNTSVHSLTSLYSTFLAVIHPLLCGKMVICFPHFIAGERLLLHAGFAIQGKYRWLLHHSLEKEIFVVYNAALSK